MTHEELEREGWEKRSCEREPRLSELVALYEELGFEVLLLPARPEDFSGKSPECRPCLDEAVLAQYKTLYTRRQRLD